MVNKKIRSAISKKVNHPNIEDTSKILDRSSNLINSVTTDEVCELSNYYYHRTPLEEEKLEILHEITFHAHCVMRNNNYKCRAYSPITNGLMSTQSSPLIIDNTTILTPTNSRNLILDVFVSNHPRLYEISTQFREEIMDESHLPSFHQLTFVRRPAHYIHMINECETYLKNIISRIKDHQEFFVPQVNSWLNKPWKRITYFDAIKKYLDVEILEPTSIKQAQYEKWLDETVKLLEFPTFITEYPQNLGSSASGLLYNKHVKQRTELFWPGGLEIANIWGVGSLTTLQEIEHMQQKITSIPRLKNLNISCKILTSLEIGIGSCAIGVERFAMALTGTSINEIINL